MLWLLQVNIDYKTAQEVEAQMHSPHPDMFNRAQQDIYLLMHRDSFGRFVKSDLFQAAIKR